MFFFTTSEPITDNSIVTDLLDKIAKLTKRVEDLEDSTAGNNKAIEQNTKRHENVDFSLNNLCPLIDEIFDANNHPGSTKFDCCHEFYTETSGQIGNAMLCTSESFCQHQDFIQHHQQDFKQTLAENHQSIEK